MSKRMLIDASHPEETRVVVLDGNKVEEFDFESASRRPLKGNIYLAKVTRVEPSLQAAFVEYGGNRQGFLAFSEIHPDYYQIPVADRMALLADQSRRLMDEDDEVDEVTTEVAAATKGVPLAEPADDDASEASPEPADDEDGEAEDETEAVSVSVEGAPAETAASDDEDEDADTAETAVPAEGGIELDDESSLEASEAVTGEPQDEAEARESVEELQDIPGGEAPDDNVELNADASSESDQSKQSQSIAESTGTPAPAERKSRRRRTPRRRQYKIQEVIRRKQIILVQVVKEERGNKGASVTTYLSLAGRYCVLMPNTPRGGGISRKITSLKDRKRLKSAAQSLELPEGMGLIIRTAGANRTKAEIRRDYEYLLRLWDSVRELTLKSNAPALVYEEGNLIKRSIRDLYGKEVSEVLVDGEAGYREAKDFMRMLMPSHAKNVKLYKDAMSLFQRHHVESQLDAMFSPVVTLKSGGYIVINQTEALVSVDVNSGKATREHSIEDTAYKTNLEAADEIARQLRLRDLAGLVVIDFIDMEDSKNDRNVEKRLREAVRHDRARIQIGKISQFGLLEMSRQRLRAGVLAGSTVSCPHCDGLGYIRSTESAALQLLRALDDEAQNQVAESLIVYAPNEIIVYALNHKRAEISRLEQEYEMSVVFEERNTLSGGTFEIERVGKRAPTKQVKRAAVTVDAVFQEEEPETAEMTEDASSAQAEPAQEQDAGEDGADRKRRRRRRRGGRGRNQPQTDSDAVAASEESTAQTTDETAPAGDQTVEADASPASDDDTGEKKRRRRRRGRRGRKRDDAKASEAQPQEPHEETGVSEDQADSAKSGTEENLPAFEITPNAPSAPQWSFTNGETARESSEITVTAETETPEEDVPPSEVEASTEEDGALTDVVAERSAEAEIVTEPTPAPEKSEENDAPASPPRKGWWQRRLGI